MSGLVQFFYPSVETTSNTNHNTSTITTSATTTTSPGRNTAVHKSVVNQNSNSAENINQEQEQERSEYEKSLGNIHEYVTTTEASLAIGSTTPNRPTPTSSYLSHSANSKTTLSRNKDRTNKNEHQNASEGMERRGAQREQQQGQEEMMKQRMKEWKHYCYNDLKEYLSLRLLDSSDRNEDGEEGEEDIDIDGNETKKMEEVEKMIGKYYYDSEIEDDEEERNREVNDAQNQNDNLDGKTLSSSSQSQMIEDSQDAMMTMHDQLETQPPLHHEPSSSSSQEHQTIQELTPPTIMGETTRKETGANTSQSPNKNVSIAQHNTYGKQIQNLHQSQSTNSSFYSCRASHDGDQYSSNTNDKQTESVAGTIRNQKATKKKTITNIQEKERQEQNSSYKKQRYKNGIVPIPPISKATEDVSKIQDIHLETTRTISIPLASIKFWVGKKIHQVHNNADCKTKMKTCAEYECNNDNDITYEYEKASLEKLISESLKESSREYGPMHQNYKLVLIMELLELDEATAGEGDSDHDKHLRENETHEQSERNKRIRQSATAAFQPNGVNDETCTTAATTSTSIAKNDTKKKSQNQRIRVFFYNNYAKHIIEFMKKLKSSTKSFGKDSSQQKCTKSFYPYLVSLQDIPAKCIFPYYMGRAERASESLLEKDFGRLSPFCICVGGEGVAVSNDGEKISFHSDTSEVRFLPLIPEGKEDEFMLCEQNERYDIVPVTFDQSCVMAERYSSLVKRSEENQTTRNNCQLLKDIEMEGDETNMGVVERSSPVADKNITSISSRGTKRKRTVGKDPVYTLLNEIENIFQKTRDKRGTKEKEVSVYGIVLSSGIPKLTRKGDWMIQLTITDDSIGERFDNDDPNNGAIKEDQVIPSVTITAFNTDKDLLPNGLCAGDIFRGHRLVVEDWNNSVVLSSLKWSTFCIVRPKAMQRFNLTPTSTTTTTRCEWELSGCQKRPLDTSRVGELWRYGQRLLLNRPTINPKFRTRIENICPYTDNESEEKYGDIIVMIARFIPYPSSRLTSNSPRGFLRVWDGTGPPATDPLPFGINMIPQNEPSSEAVSSIAKVIDWVNSRSKYSTNNTIGLPPLNLPKSLCGRVVSVVIWETTHWNLIQNSKDSFAAGKFIRLRNVKEGNLYSPESSKKGPRCLHADASTLLTPIPDHSYDVVTLLEHHNQRITQGFPHNPRSGLLPIRRKLPEEVLSGQYTFTSLPQRLRKLYYERNKTWYNLIECMIDESSDKVYPVRFQIMNSLCLPIEEGSSEKYVVFDVRDKTARCAVIVSSDNTSTVLDKCIKTGDENISLEDKALDSLKNQVYESTIGCREINGTKYFVLVNELNEYSAQHLLPQRSHTVP